MYFNAHSIFNKIDSLNVFLTQRQPDIVLLSETWNSDKITNAMLSIPGYSLEPELRMDRKDTTNGIGGGLMVYIKDGISIKPDSLTNPFNQYCKFTIESTNNNDDIHIVLFYRSPNTTGENTSHLTNLLSKCEKNTIFIGDLNMPAVNWTTNTGPAKCREFLAAVDANQLTQLVDFPSHERGAILDVLLTNSPEKIIDTTPLGYLGGSDHTIISFDIQTQVKIRDSQEKIFDWSKADYDNLGNYFSGIKWSEELANKNAEESWQVFTSKLHEGMSTFVPLNPRRNPYKPPWFTKHNKKLSHNKQKLWDKYRHTGKKEDFDKYKAAEKSCKKSISRAKKKYEKKLSSTNNLRPFNAYIRQKTKSRVEIGPLKQGGRSINDSTEMAEVLNTYFSSVFTRENLSNIPAPLDEPYVSTLEDMHFTYQEVVEAINNLKVGSAPGPDRIPSIILKQFNTILAVPLTIVFNKSMTTGVVPNDWKEANVTPIYKKGKKCDASNYRPISLTSIPGKLMESLIKAKIVDHIDYNNLINQSQHGFMSNKSTITNLVQFFNKITEDVDNGEAIDLLYLDFSKAFDKVPHQRLRAKLAAHGVLGKVLDWITNWLSNRRQRTVLNGSFSNWLEVLSGVPQGSVLGPLLFLIFINDIDKAAPEINYLNKFADDTKAAQRVNCNSDHVTFQHGINNLYEWAKNWGMEFNVSKCHILHIGRQNQSFPYTMAGSILPTSTEEKDLGVIISNTLAPSKQCAEAARKARGVLFNISKSFHYRDRHVFVRLYKQYVRCLLEYAAPVWNPWLISDIDCLEKVQKTMVNLIPGLVGSTYQEKLSELGLDTLEDRRVRQDMVQVYRIITGKDKVDPHSMFVFYGEQLRPTRMGSYPWNIVEPRCRTDMRRNFFTNRVATKWNALPREIKDAPTVNTFKARYDKFMNLKD